MSDPGLAKIGSIPESPDTVGRIRRALARLANPLLVVTRNGVYLDTEGRIAVRPGTAATPYRAITSATTIASTDYFIHVTSGTFTQPLPTAVGIGGTVYIIRNSGGGTVTIDPAGAELIDGAATLAVGSGSTARIVSTNAAWITW